MSANGGQMVEASLRGELESRYLAYALSTIISRSLPDVRDGLKPVHRRILFAMRALHLDPGAAFKKSARVVGDVIGKFHPHGDQAAYDAMVRLAQEFAVRYPLVDGQGNFGNIDGDSAAAMRYTEARLTKVAQALLDDLESNTVAMQPTYDGSQEEPTVLPARFPNLLANGATGIAVGMSTSIPPHNVGEIIDACLHLIDNPDVTVAQLLKFLPAPDFPTGGVLVSEEAERREVYETGRGTLRLRARWEVEQLPRGLWRIVITEIPYQVQKSKLIERIAQLVIDRKCLFLEDIRDESDSLVRIVLEPKSRTLEPEKVMAFLFRNSDLEVRVPVNLNVITGQLRPEVMDLKGLLRAWLEHRFEIHTRRATYELERIGARLHLLKAFLTVHLNIDEVVAIIKENDDPAPVLMYRFLLDKIQAEAILDMRLRSLRKLEEMSIRKEMGEKEARAAELNAMLADQRVMWKAIRAELKQTRKDFADPRRTELATAVEVVELKPEELVEKEPLTVILSRKGWVRAIKGHDVDGAKLRFKEGDGLRALITAQSTDTLSFVSDTGKAFSTLAGRLSGGKGVGEPLSVLFDVEGTDRVRWLMVAQPEQEYFVATRMGQGFRIKGADLATSHRKGKQTITFKVGDQLLHILPVKGPLLAAIGRSRRLLVCKVEEFPLLPKGMGVRIMKLIAGELLADVTTFTPEEGFVLDTGKKQRQIADVELWTSLRATRGAMLPHGFLTGAVFQGTGASLLVAGKGLTGDLFDDEDG